MANKPTPKKKETNARKPALKKKKIATKPRIKQTAETRRPKKPTDPTSEEKSQIFNELSPQDFKVIKEITNSNNKTSLEALKKAGVPLKKSDIKRSRDAVGRILRKPAARIAFRAICRRKGINLNYLADHLKDGLEATKTVSAVATDKQAGAGSVDFVDVPDWSARHKYFQLAIEIENITVDEQAGSGDSEENYVDRIVRLKKLVKGREEDQAAIAVEMVDS